MGWSFGSGPPLIAGPCAVESDAVMRRVADVLAQLGARLGVPVCLKASFDKANRARGASPRGPGLEAGLEALSRVKRESGLPVMTDIHEPGQARIAAAVVDALQIPAFLCRQTDLLRAAGATGLPVNVKKGQWMAPEEMTGAVEKVRGAGAGEVALTERGTFFGYGDLVVDMRGFRRMREAAGVPVLFDATHAVQRSGRGEGGASGGCREDVPALLLAAAAAGADGFYLETHPDPAQAQSDRATQWPLDRLEDLVARALDAWHAGRATQPSRGTAHA
jgi:2-dehydro-3-deoxyphosphooctonate aldolase (KDO 8-P synthase)